MVLWAILKWEQSDEGWKSKCWILLIFYLLGLSVGIHLLNILTLPALALIFYYKKFKTNIKGTILTSILYFLLIVILIFGIIPGVAAIAALYLADPIKNEGWIIIISSIVNIVSIKLLFGHESLSSRLA